MKILEKSKRLLPSTLVALIGLSLLTPTPAQATSYTAPSIPTVPIQLIADNNFSILLGNENGPTRVFYQNQDSWGNQLSAAASLNVTPTVGEDYLYVLAMGSGGYEGWGGTIGGQEVTQYPGAQVAIDTQNSPIQFTDPNPTCDPFGDPADPVNQQNCMMDPHGGQQTFVNNYLDFSNAITGLHDHQASCNQTAHPGCNTVDNGGFTDSTLLQDVQRKIAEQFSNPSLLSSDLWKSAVDDSMNGWPNTFTPPADNGTLGCGISVCSTSVGFAWNFPSNEAVLFRYPLSQVTPGIIPGDSSVNLHVQNIDPTATGLRVNYRPQGTNFWSSQDFDLSLSNPGNLLVTGLINGITYEFMLEATDGTAGSPPTSIGVDSAIYTASLPDAPIIQAVNSGMYQLTVDFTPPMDPANSGVQGYDYSTDAGLTWVSIPAPALGSPIIISTTSTSGGVAQLQAGISYPVSLRAELGSGPTSPSNSLAQFATGTQMINFAALAPVKITVGTLTLGSPGYSLATSTSGLTPTYSSTTTSVCTVSSSGVIALLSVGTCTITAEQSGDPIFATANPVDRDLFIIPDLPQAVSIETVTVTATAGSGANGSAVIEFTEPTITNGATISNYLVTATSSSESVTVSVAPGAGNEIGTLNGLIVGHLYTITVGAVNDAGAPVIATWNLDEIPAIAPEPVTNLTAVQGAAGVLTVHFTPPTSLNGGRNPAYNFYITPHGLNFSNTPDHLQTAPGVSIPADPGYAFTLLSSTTSYDIKVVIADSGNGRFDGNLRTATILQSVSPAAPVVQQVTTAPVLPQSERVIDISPSHGVATEKTSVIVTGSFDEKVCKVTAISLGGVNLPIGSWSVSSSALRFTMPAHTPGSSTVQIFNGCSPLVAALTFTYDAAAIAKSPTPTPTPTPTPKPIPTPIVTPSPQHSPTPTPATVKASTVTAKLSVYFALNSATLTQRTLQAVRRFAASLSGAAGSSSALSISIIGYAQPTAGTEKSDQLLSKRRAVAVGNELRRLGVAAKISASGAGRDKVNVARARRVEVIATYSK